MVFWCYSDLSSIDKYWLLMITKKSKNLYNINILKTVTVLHSKIFSVDVCLLYFIVKYFIVTWEINLFPMRLYYLPYNLFFKPVLSCQFSRFIFIKAQFKNLKFFASMKLKIFINVYGLTKELGKLPC